MAVASAKTRVTETRQPRWVVYDFDKLTTRSFPSKSDAIDWLAKCAAVQFIPVESSSPLATHGIHLFVRGIRYKDLCWDGPVPVVAVCTPGGNSSARMLLADFRLPNDQQKSGSQMSDQLLEDTLGDENFDPIVFAARKLGYIRDSGPLENEQALSEAQLRDVTELAETFRLPGITCALDYDWRADDIFAIARCLPVHAGAVRVETNLDELRGVALEIERSLSNLHPNCSNDDFFHFWTSLEVQRFLKARYEKLNDRGSDGRHEARHKFSRWLASYAYSLRFSSPLPTSEYQSVQGFSDSQSKQRKRLEPDPDPEALLANRPFVTYRTAAKAIGVSTRTVYKLVEAGDLKTIGKGSAKKIRTDSLRRQLGLPSRKSENSGNRRK